MSAEINRISTTRLYWTYHSREKMRFYRLSEARVKRVIHSPKRIEEGIAPKTIAMMQPTQIFHGKTWAGKPASAREDKRQETWNQEIWVMLQKKRKGTSDKGQEVIKIISAWHYPGTSKPRSEIMVGFLRGEYEDFLKNEDAKDERRTEGLKKFKKSKWFRQ